MIYINKRLVSNINQNRAHKNDNQAAGTELADAYSPDTVIASSPGKEVHDPWAFYLHAALLRQAFAHCGKFPTAAAALRARPLRLSLTYAFAACPLRAIRLSKREAAERSYGFRRRAIAIAKALSLIVLFPNNDHSLRPARPKRGP